MGLTAMSSFGEGEGELLTLHYPKPLPMRLNRWLVAQRPSKAAPASRSSSRRAMCE
jgi:hypothetical protein